MGKTQIKGGQVRWENLLDPVWPFNDSECNEIAKISHKDSGIISYWKLLQLVKATCLTKPICEAGRDIKHGCCGFHKHRIAEYITQTVYYIKIWIVDINWGLIVCECQWHSQHYFSLPQYIWIHFETKSKLYRHSTLHQWCE